MANDWVRNYRWTEDMDTKMASAYLLGLPMQTVAQHAGIFLSPQEAQVLIYSRLQTLKEEGRVPGDYRRTYSRSAEMTMEEGYTLGEDVELMEWCVSNKTRIDAEIFVEKNRSAAGMRKRADWLCSLPELSQKAFEIEREAAETLAQIEKHQHNRDSPCAKCDKGELDAVATMLGGMEDGPQ